MLQQQKLDTSSFAPFSQESVEGISRTVQFRQIINQLDLQN